MDDEEMDDDEVDADEVDANHLMRWMIVNEKGM